MHARTTIAPTLAGLAILALAGCSVDATPLTTPSDEMTTSVAQVTRTMPVVPEALVSVASVDGLGDILVDGDGHALYTYDPDDASGMSSCVGDCAGAWPPLLTNDAPTAGTGIDPSLLGTTARGDGTLQVTYAGWPLYHYASDDTDGTAGGQASGGVWWVLDATGTQVRN